MLYWQRFGVPAGFAGLDAMTNMSIEHKDSNKLYVEDVQVTCLT
jgi:hypothetical protein